MSSTDPVQHHALPEHDPSSITTYIPTNVELQAQEEQRETLVLRELLRATLYAAPVEMSEQIFEALPDESQNARLNALLHGTLSGGNHPDLTSDILGALELAEEPRIGGMLRAALHEDSALLGHDFADDLFAALASEDPQLSQALQSAVQAPLPPDFIDELFGTLEDIQASPKLAQALQGAVQAPADFAEDFTDSIMDALEPSPALTQALQGAVQADPFDLSDAVLDGILDTFEAQAAATPASRHNTTRVPTTANLPIRRTTPPPSRTGFWHTLSMVAPAVATLGILLVMFGQAPNPNLPDPTPATLQGNGEDFRNGFAIQDQNEAEVEDIAFAAASVQVMQFEDNGPTFILVDEGEPSDTTVPL